MLQVDNKGAWKDCTLLIQNKNLDIVGIAVFGLCSRHLKKKKQAWPRAEQLIAIVFFCLWNRCDDTLSLLSGSFIEVKQYENANFLYLFILLIWKRMLT